MNKVVIRRDRDGKYFMFRTRLYDEGPSLWRRAGYALACCAVVLMVFWLVFLFAWGLGG